jgi:hypothetical protein
VSDTFHLVDLRSQAASVQSLLRGRPAAAKLEWLASHGLLTPKPKKFPDERQSFWFETPLRVGCAFFLDGDEFVFIGDHTTFTVQDLR